MAENLADAREQWLEIARVMRLADDEFEQDVPEELQLKSVEAAGGGAMVVFRVEHALYVLEPTRGVVIEMRRDGTTRLFDPDGVELEASGLRLPLGRPELN